jgi:hypothetical protein
MREKKLRMGRKLPIDQWSWWPTLLFVLFLLGDSLAFSQGIIVHLKNGDRLTGQIVSESTNEISLTNSVYGTVKIPLDMISKREAAPAAPTPAPSTNVAAAASTNVVIAPSTNAPPAGGTNQITITKEEKKKIAPIKPVNLEAQSIASTPDYWDNQIQFGVNLRYSTADQQEFLVIEKSTYTRQPFRHIFDLNFTYGKTEGVQSANRLAASEKTEFQFSKKAYAFGLVGGGYDQIRQVDAQFEIDPGFGLEILNSTNHAFVWKTEEGFNFQKEFRQDDSHLTTYSLRVAEIFAGRIYDKLTADAKLEFFPNLQDFGEFRFRLENNWRYPLTDRLSLDMVVIDLYDTLAPPGVNNNDLQIRSTLGIKF